MALLGELPPDDALMQADAVMMLRVQAERMEGSYFPSTWSIRGCTALMLRGSSC